IKLIQEALAASIKIMNEANPSEPVIKLKALEAFAAAANGTATKIIIPSEIQGLAGLCASAKAMFESDAPKAPAKPAPKADN
ncbi:MAG: peptidase, partial [Pseudoflavonifractor sp.]